MQNIAEEHRDAVVTIGNFDGVHAGHRCLLQHVIDKAEKLNTHSLVITFEPQPKEFFSPNTCPPRLTRLREKLHHLRNLGIDQVLCLHFNVEIANWMPQEFIKNLLVDKLGVRHLVVGNDFRFGRQRQGDVALLQTVAQHNGFTLETIDKLQLDTAKVSSTRIRQALAAGDLAAAKHLLGRSYSMIGRVAHGDKRGRILGFPTANVYLHRKVSPITGVYAVKAHEILPEAINGVANVGRRPTVAGDNDKMLLEVHLFDFNQDIYNRYMEIEFVHKIRDEQKFESFEQLKQQITHDAQIAQDYFKEK